MLQIIGLSLQVSITAVLIVCLIGLPFGAFLAIVRLPGRFFCIVFVNAAMGLPPVVVGLMLYLLFS